MDGIRAREAGQERAKRKEKERHEQTPTDVVHKRKKRRAAQAGQVRTEASQAWALPTSSRWN